MAGVKKVYLDVVGNNPWMGDYKLSRQGEFEEVSGSVYKIKWTGHGETTKGFLRRVSPVETNVVASVNVRNMKVDFCLLSKASFLLSSPLENSTLDSIFEETSTLFSVLIVSTCSIWSALLKNLLTSSC